MIDDVKTKLQDRCEFGLQAALALETSIRQARPPNAVELAALAYRIRLCNTPGNQWYASDLHTQDGELYDGSGRFWQCNSKLCTNCLRREASRRRRAVQQAIEEQKIPVGQDLRFLTLTIPNQSLSLIQSRALIYDAWTRFRKRQWFKDHVAGYARTEEFTVTDRGFHYHLHLIAQTRYIDYGELRREWTDCVTNVFRDAKREIQWNTSDGLAMVNCQKINSLKEAIHEVCKYLTKSDSWSKLHPDVIIEVASIRRYPRSFELGGCFAVAERLKGRFSLEGTDESTEKSGTRNAILDNGCSSDGSNTLYWRDRVHQVGPIQYLHELQQEVSDVSVARMEQLKRKFHAADFRRLRPVPLSDPDVYCRQLGLKLTRMTFVTSIAELDAQAKAFHAGDLD